MDRDKIKAQLGSTAIDIAEKCVAGALAVAGVVTIATSADAAPATATGTSAASVATLSAVVPNADGAILLDIVQRDPLTGEMVAQHYSHASHASHSSHSSHYSSRP